MNFEGMQARLHGLSERFHGSTQRPEVGAILSRTDYHTNRVLQIYALNGERNTDLPLPQDDKRLLELFIRESLAFRLAENPSLDHSLARFNNLRFETDHIPFLEAVFAKQRAAASANTEYETLSEDEQRAYYAPLLGIAQAIANDYLDHPPKEEFAIKKDIARPLPVQLKEAFWTMREQYGGQRHIGNEYDLDTYRRALGKNPSRFKRLIQITLTASAGGLLGLAAGQGAHVLDYAMHPDLSAFTRPADASPLPVTLQEAANKNTPSIQEDELFSVTPQLVIPKRLEKSAAMKTITSALASEIHEKNSSGDILNRTLFVDFLKRAVMVKAAPGVTLYPFTFPDYQSGKMLNIPFPPDQQIGDVPVTTYVASIGNDGQIQTWLNAATRSQNGTYLEFWIPLQLRPNEILVTATSLYGVPVDFNALMDSTAFENRAKRIGNSGNRF